ncbi:hypothetical protein Tco_1281649 [Tanacetum coccineum]
MLPSEARMMTFVWIPSENSLPKVDIAVVFWLYVNPFFQSGYASLPLQRIMEENEGSEPVMMRSNMLQNARCLSEPGSTANTTGNNFADDSKPNVTD